MASSAKFTRSTPVSAANTRCRSRTSVQVVRTRSAAKYLELVPGEKLRYTDVFDDPNLPGEMITTITLRKVMCGTELHVTQEGIPAMIPAEMCYLGWQESLAQLSAPSRAGDSGRTIVARCVSKGFQGLDRF